MLKLTFLVNFLIATLAYAQTPDDVVDMTEAGENSTKITVSQPSSEKKKSEELEDEEVKAAPTGKNVEKIEVTGSYIRRIDTEGPSPVVTITKDDFDAAAVDTVSDYLREDPLFNGSTDDGNRDGYFQFRGQHAGSSLVLLNGIRMPKLGGPDRGFYNGVQSISTNVIERVEVLKDGSSALYGSDAQAGVINFITRKDYDGAEFATRVNVPEMGVGLQQNHNMSFGKNYARGNWFASVQYTEQRGYTEADIGNTYTQPTRPFSTSGTTSVNGQTTRFQADCPPGSPDGRCSTDATAQTMVRDPRTSVGTLLSGRYDINSDLNVTMMGIYNRRVRKDIGYANGIVFSRETGNALTASQIGSQALKQNATGDDVVELSFYPNDEVGLARVDVLENSYTAQTKVEGYYGDTWTWNLTGGYAYSIEEREHKNGLINLNAVEQALADGFNPMNIGQNNDALRSAQVQGIEAYEASMSTARLMTTGELFQFSDLWGTGGPMSLAIGMEGQWETTNDDHDALLIDTPLNQDLGPNQFGSRTVSSVFMELASYPLNNVEVQLAGRYDRYSDFGDTFNPKVALGWRPTNKVLLRSSWGTTFSAPSVRNMIQREYQDTGSFQFCKNDDPDCQSNSIIVTRYRDPNLTNETGVNYNFGTVIQPNRNWSFSFDQWNFQGENTLAKLGSAYESIYASTPGDEGINAVGVTLERDSNGNVIAARMPEVVNQGQVTIRGVDFDINFKSPIRLLGRTMRMNLGTRHSHTIVRKSQSSPVADPFSYGDLEWKNTTTASLSSRGHSYRLAARTLGGNSGAFYSTDSHTEYDFTYGYNFSWDGRLSVGVKNLVNRRPPVNRNTNFIDFNSDRDTYAFQPLGRRYFVGYRQSF